MSDLSSRLKSRCLELRSKSQSVRLLLSPISNLACKFYWTISWVLWLFNFNPHFDHCMSFADISPFGLTCLKAFLVERKTNWLRERWSKSVGTYQSIYFGWWHDQQRLWQRWRCQKEGTSAWVLHRQTLGAGDKWRGYSLQDLGWERRVHQTEVA